MSRIVAMGDSTLPKKPHIRPVMIDGFRSWVCIVDGLSVWADRPDRALRSALSFLESFRSPQHGLEILERAKFGREPRY